MNVSYRGTPFRVWFTPWKVLFIIDPDDMVGFEPGKIHLDEDGFYGVDVLAEHDPEIVAR